jgi:hypothetical protein
VNIQLDLVRDAHAQDAVAQDSTGAGDNLVFSKEKVKQLLTAAVQRLTGHELSIRGDLDIDLGWQTTVSANDVSFANAQWAETPNMLTIKSLRAQIDIGALLEGRIVAPSIELDQPQVILAINKQGESNLPTMGDKEEQAKEAFDLASIPVVRHFAVRDGTIVYKDLGTDTQLEAQIASLSLEAQENQPITVSGKGSYDGAPFELGVTAGSWEKLRSDDGEPYQFKLQSSLGPLQMQASGAIENPLKLAGLQVHVTGDDIPDVYPLAQLLAEKTPSFDISAQISSRAKDNGQQYRLSDLQARLGESTLSGRLTAELGNGKPEIRGELTSKLIRLRI